MKKVLFLNKEKKYNSCKFKSDSILENKVERHCNKFKNKFINENNFYSIDEKNNLEIKLVSVIEKLICFKNKTPMIDFLNSIYCDGWGTSNTSIKYEKNEELKKDFDIMIQVKNDYKRIEYKIRFKVKDCENLAIIIFRDDLSDESDKIISLFGERQMLNKKNRKAESNKINPYIIMLYSNIEVPDILEVKSNNETNYLYEFNVVKGWKYDLKKMYNENIYLFFPLKIFDLEKRIFSMSDNSVCYDLIKYEIIGFFKEMNNYLKKLKEREVLFQSDIEEINMIASELLLNITSENSKVLSKINQEIVDSLITTVS